jgi:divalent metal cation (Fe/Co/Zn/Cd) transporter
LIKITGYAILDPIIAILVAAFIYRAGYSISKKSFRRLMDYSLPDEDIEKIEKIITDFPSAATLKKHSIKARQTGPSKDIDLILQFPGETPICECHKVCDEIEKRIQAIYTNSSISIHSEPVCYKGDCQSYCKK